MKAPVEVLVRVRVWSEVVASPSDLRKCFTSFSTTRDTVFLPRKHQNVDPFTFYAPAGVFEASIPSMSSRAATAAKLCCSCTPAIIPISTNPISPTDAWLPTFTGDQTESYAIETAVSALMVKLISFRFRRRPQKNPRRITTAINSQTLPRPHQKSHRRPNLRP